MKPLEHYYRVVGDCWEWKLSRYRDGYGQVSVGGKGRRAHRWSWELHNGPIPSGMQVCHTCDNPPCINPSHLFLGTQADNMRDRSKKGRQDWIPNPKLTLSQVSEIRARYIKGWGGNAAQLAREFAVSRKTITNIATGETWKLPEKEGDDEQN